MPGESNPGPYRWECPICDVSGIAYENRDPPRAHVKNSVESHIRSSDDDAHAAEGTLPDGLSQQALQSAITPLDPDVDHASRTDDATH